MRPDDQKDARPRITYLASHGSSFAFISIFFRLRSHRSFFLGHWQMKFITLPLTMKGSQKLLELYSIPYLKISSEAEKIDRLIKGNLWKRRRVCIELYFRVRQPPSSPHYIYTYSVMGHMLAIYSEVSLFNKAWRSKLRFFWWPRWPNFPTGQNLTTLVWHKVPSCKCINHNLSNE